MGMVLETTLKTYERDFQAFKTWSKRNLGVRKFSLPLTESLILAYVQGRLARPHDGNEHAAEAQSESGPSQVGQPGQHDGKPLRLAAIRRHLAAVGHFHKVSGVSNPCRGEAVTKLLAGYAEDEPASAEVAGVSNGGAAAKSFRGKNGLTKRELEAMLATCQDGLVGLRDKAMLLLAAEVGGLGRSRLAALKFSDFRPRPEGFLLAVDGLLHRREKLVTGRAADALAEWFRQGRIAGGHAFRVITARSGVGEGLSDKTIVRVVKRRAELAGLDPRNYGGDSLRLARPAGLPGARNDR